MLHTNLPIHRTGVQLLTMAVTVQQHMPRSLKRHLGERISEHCMQMLDLMALANATQRAERVAHIERLLTHQRATESLLRVAHELRAVSTDRWASAVQLLQSIGAQGGGWLKSANKKAPAA